MKPEAERSVRNAAAAPPTKTGSSWKLDDAADEDVIRPPVSAASSDTKNGAPPREDPGFVRAWAEEREILSP